MEKLSVIVIGNSDYLDIYKTIRNVKESAKKYLKYVEIHLLLFGNKKESIFIKRKLSGAINKITFFGEQKPSISKLRKYSFNNIQGEYIFFIESGNYISLNTIGNFYDFKDNHSHNIYITKTKIFYGKDNYLEDNISSTEEQFTRFSLLVKNNSDLDPWGSTFFISRLDFEKIYLAEDNNEFQIGDTLQTFYCNCLESKMEVVCIPKTLSFYNTDKKTLFYKEYSIIPSTKLFDCKSAKKSYKDDEVDNDEDKRHFIKRVFSSRFPRLYKYLYKIKTNLMDKGDNRHFVKKIFSTLFPELYFKLFLIKNKFGNNSQEFLNYEDWLLTEWQKINEIEPMLFPPDYEIPYKIGINNSKLEGYYKEFMSHFPAGMDYLVFCPWLKRGGADKLALNLLKAFKNIYPNKKIGLILTENTSSEIKNLIPKGVYFFDFGNKFLDLNAVERQALLLRFIIQKIPKNIVNINSHSLFNLLLDYSKPISYYSKVYCFCFSPSKTPRGQYTGFAFNFIPRIIDNLEVVLTDNQNIIDILNNMFGLDRKKFEVLYQPVEIDFYLKKDYSKKKEWNILWASRIDYEKIPEVLERIINKSSGQKIKFHIYGNSVMDNQFPLDRFNRHKNAITYGAYTGGLRGIKGYSDYDIFLYTSQFDGMPNTVLEALSIGLPIVSSNVGGIKEVIEHKKTGFLVDEIGDESAYISMITYIKNHTNELNKIRSNAYKKLQEQHSWNIYREKVKKIFN